MIAPASRKLGKYEIIQKLGRGGMADVYLATDSVLHNRVALKLIEHAADADTCDAIEAEKRGSVLQAHLAAIDHRVVQVHDSGDVDGFFFVAMEYVDGQDLSDLMRRGPLSLEFAVDVAIAVAQTLENAHGLEMEIGGKEFHGIVHGDIKPKNIRIDARGEVRVLDFGIAKALSLSRRLTRNEFGSVPYGSPERLEAGEVNELSDLWSLAVMLYEMVTGLQPYQAATTERLERMIRSRIPPPPAPDPCPKPLRCILVKAMAPEAEERYQSAHDFREDLLAFRAGEPVQAILENLDVTRRTSPRVPRTAPETNGGAAPPVRAGRPRLAGGQVSELEVGADSPTGGSAADQGVRPTDQDTHRTVPDDETRRTRPDEATRRTERTEAKSTVVWGKDTKRASFPLVPWLTQTVWGRRTVAALILLATIWVIATAISDVVLYRRGAQLEHDIASEQVTDPNVIWNRWSELSDGNTSSWLLRGARKAVEQRLVAAADRVIDSYRNSAVVVYETTWNGARDDLSRALSLDPDDTVRGKLRLTEGHLARIASTRDHGSAVLVDLNQAVEKFTEADHLLPKSPDPELGLARVYVYGLKDMDKAYQALQEAERRGYPMGNREKAYLADGYRERADELVKTSDNVRELPQEKDELQRAKEDYDRALQLYQEIVPYPYANVNIIKVQNSLEKVNSRLQEIERDSMPHLGNGNALRKLPRSVPPWIQALIRNIWPSHAAKQ
jgi:serine/threonine protein kinase/tetratricopeptide (TPR) repeat protein